MTREDATESVAQALRAKGGQLLPFEVERNGVQVTESGRAGRG
jgi:hypothetical protein